MLTPTETRPALIVRDVSKHFRGVVALADISLHLRQDEILGLIGPNGSGKTTLMNVISGVMAPSGGEVKLGEQPITGWPSFKVARCGVGRTFQQIRLFNDLTVAENVRFGAAAKGLKGDGERIQHILAVLELEREAELWAGTLSYGHQRRVEIARALAGEPDVLLLDEPAAGMNEEETAQLLGRIEALHDEMGCAVLIVEHDLHFMSRLCHRIYVLAEGHVISEGAPAQVMRDPIVIKSYIGHTEPNPN